MKILWAMIEQAVVLNIVVLIYLYKVFKNKRLKNLINYIYKDLIVFNKCRGQEGIGRLIKKIVYK